ncbi:MAG: VCBS repeat-containing protein [Myxococcales bacterium]|nr:VCBS repeat-containing protein [Myxococcales bacterium]
MTRPLPVARALAVAAALLGACSGAEDEPEPQTSADGGAAAADATSMDGGLRDGGPTGPRTLAFVQALPDLTAPPAAQVVHDAVAFDVDGDGDPDLVLATDDGLRVLINDGAARFTLDSVEVAPPEPPPPVDAGLAADVGPPPDAGPADAEVDVGLPPEPPEPLREPVRPGGRGAVYDLALTVTGPDRTPALVACTGAARDLLLGPTPGGLTPIAELPLRAGACRRVAVGDVDGDGMPELAALVDAGDGPGLWITRVPRAGAARLDEDLTPPADAVGPVGQATTTVEGATATFDRALGDAAGGGAAADAVFALPAGGGEAVFALPVDLPFVPDAVRLQLRAEGDAVTVTPRVVDATGAAFDGPPLAVGASWRAAAAEGVDGWTRADGEAGTPAAPLSAFALVVTADDLAAGVLRVDEVVAERDGFMPRLIDDFERRAPRFAWDGATGLVAGDVDGDAHHDLLVLRGEAAPALLTTRDGGGLTARTVRLEAPGALRDGVLLDADGDGNLDALLTGGGRDRLLVGDGFGRLLDITEGALPLDWADGRSVVAADVDGDGLTDLVIGNAGTTDRLYLGRADGRFRDVTPRLGFDALDTAAVVVADLDGDGRLDVASVPRAGDAHTLLRMAVDP